MSRRIASLQAEQKTKEELQLLPDDDPEEHNDKDFKDDMAPSYKRKEVAPMPSRRGYVSLYGNESYLLNFK